VVFANVFGYSVEDYVEVVRVLEDAEGLAGYGAECFVPQYRSGRDIFAHDPVLLAEVVGAVRRAARRPLIVKLSPNVSRIEPAARAAAEAGADALSLVNTLVALAINAQTRRPGLATASEGSPVRPSSPSRCAWCMRRRRPSRSR